MENLAVEPSGLVLWFVGSCFIADSISLMVICSFMFSISSSFHSVLGNCTFQEFVHFLYIFHFVVVSLFVVISSDPLYFCSVGCNFLFFISFLILLIWTRFFFSFDESVWRFVNFVSLFKEPALSVTDLFYFCLYFIYLWSDVYDLFPLTNFVLFVFLFLVALSVKLGNLFEIFLVSLSRLVSP